MNNVQDLREKILAINRDQSLTPQQKQERIRELSAPRAIPVTKEVPSECEHYLRGCDLKAECCGKFWPCRICHDEAADHKIDRYAIKEMRCRNCGEVQDVAKNCRACEKEMAQYFCDVCNFFDDDPNKDIYHCDKCKLCRIGKGLGIDYFHCDKCNACMHISLTDHKCVEDTLSSDCPVCTEKMFTSREPVTFLLCGHSIHLHCYEEYVKTNYTCPICKKSVGDMSQYFEKLDEHVNNTPMPEEYRELKQKILCNDCGGESEVPFHLYHKCLIDGCGSYNTTVTG